MTEPAGEVLGVAIPPGPDRERVAVDGAVVDGLSSDEDVERGEGDGDGLAQALEAICFALNRPLGVAEAASILGRSPAAVRRAVEQLAVHLRGSALMLQRHGEDIQLVTRPGVAWAVQRALNPERPSRLSRAALETLAIVAYRQPITRTGVEAIRGVNCEAVLEGLERRELVEEVGRQESPGHPRLYGTTLRFLQVVGLESIDELPPLRAGESPSLTAGRLGLEEETAEDGTAGPGPALTEDERAPGSS